MALEVKNNADLNRYEIKIDGQSAGHVEYVINDGAINLTHTELMPAYRAQADEIAKGALELVQTESDARVITTCGLITRTVDANPEYQGLRTR